MMNDMIHLSLLLGLLLLNPDAEPFHFQKQEHASGCLLAIPDPSHFPAEYEAGHYQIRLSHNRQYAQVCLMLDQDWVRNATQLHLWMDTAADTLLFSRDLPLQDPSLRTSPVLLHEFCQADQVTGIRAAIDYADGTTAQLTLAEGLMLEDDPNFWQLSLQIQGAGAWDPPVSVSGGRSEPADPQAAPQTQTHSRPYLSIGTNLLSLLTFGTMEADFGLGLSRHYSLHLKGIYNPFSWQASEQILQNKQATLALQGRYWPWFIFSGWYYGTKLQYSVFNRGGLHCPRIKDGIAYGIGLETGYAWMMSKHLNLEFGIGLWGGYASTRTFASARCGKLLERHQGGFCQVDRITIALQYTF